MNHAITRMGRNITTIIAATAAALMTGALSVRAATHDTPAVVVKYDGSTIDSATGARVLYQRIESAARQVCPDDSTKEPARAAMARRCQKDAVERAVHAIGNPQLAKILGDISNRG